MKKAVTRKELYDLVWVTPMTKLAKEFNLSDNGLRKICKKHNIPMPEMGYWQKVAFNKKVAKEPLPNKEEYLKEIEINDEKSVIQTNKSISDVFLERIYNNKSLILTVPDRLTNPDSITLKTQSDLNDRPNRWVSSQGIVHTSRGLPDIEVGLKNISRALRLLDTLIKNFRILDYEISLTSEGLFIGNGEETMKIYIREKSNAKDTVSSNGWKSRELIPNGRLAIKLGFWGQFEFADSASSTVEEKVVKILAKAGAEFHRISEIRLKWKIEQEKQDEIRRRKEAEQKRKEDELNRFKHFFNAAHRWKKFMVMKEYFEHLQLTQTTSHEDLEWLKLKLDWYDPSVESNDELLVDVDRETLTFRK